MSNQQPVEEEEEEEEEEVEEEEGEAEGCCYLFCSFRHFGIGSVDAVRCRGRRWRNFLVQSAQQKIQFIVEHLTFVTDRLAVVLLRFRLVGRHFRDELFDGFAQNSASETNEQFIRRPNRTQK